MKLIKAIRRHSLEEVRMLLDQGADPNMMDDHGNPALINAIEYMYPEIVLMLLMHGADPMSRNCDGDTALEMVANAIENFATIFNALVEKGADIHEGNEGDPYQIVSRIQFSAEGGG
ncbi:MAG: ankyrin repeat domain-containing protein [Nanoarchaeota archaeon]